MSETPFYINGQPAPRPDEKKDEPIVWLRPELIAPWREIILILLIVTGPFAVRSAWEAFHGSSATYMNRLLSNPVLITTGAIESGLLALFMGFLYWRKWRSEDFKVKPDILSSFQGLALLIPAEIGNAAIVFGLLTLSFMVQSHYANFGSFLSPADTNPKHLTIDAGWGVLICTMVLNAFYEELTCMGYAFNQFAAKKGPVFALIATVLLRMSCHTYQGPIHVLGIGVLFLIYGLWYWHTRNLWALIFGHAILDITSLGMLKAFSGH